MTTVPQLKNPHVRDLFEIGKPLVDDYELCKKRVNDKNSAFWRRAFVRATCAYIEGSTSAMRRFALEFAVNRSPKDLALISALSGESHVVADNGKVSKRDSRIPTLQNIAMVFRYYAKRMGRPTN